MKIDLCNIELDQSTQCRAEMRQEVIDEYAAEMGQGTAFPPIDVYGTKEKCWIADGWHRVMAARELQLSMIDATVHHGGRTEAVKHALKANREHGCRRTAGDVARAIEVAYREFPASTQQQIADMVGCARSHVSTIRKELVTADKLNLPDRVTGADGKERPTSYKPQTEEVNRDDDETTEQTNPPRPEPLRYVPDEQEPTQMDAASSHQPSQFDKAVGDMGSETLWHLKRYWMQASRKDKREFKEWINENDN